MSEKISLDSSELILQNSYIDSFKTKKEKSQTIRFIFSLATGI